MIKNTGEALAQLQEVIDQLTGPEGCPWDKAQTPQSLADYVIEECHELVSAIRADNARGVQEELGDVLFLLLCIARWYEKQGLFAAGDAMDTERLKMIRRHPHVFAGAKFADLDEQLRAWEAIKKQEHHESGDAEGLFASLPASLPPLIKAYRIHSRAARIGFTWPTDEEVEEQLESEWLEWLDAAQGEDNAAQKHELGDMLFSLVEVGRRKGIKASEALELTNLRFLRRFSIMEELAASQGHSLDKLTLDQMDELWEMAKQRLAEGHES